MSKAEIDELIRKSKIEHAEMMEKLDGDVLTHVARKVCDSYENDGKLLLCGNGGSAADSQHIAAEMVCKFKLERKPYQAMALTTDSSVLTAIANDYGYEHVFERQVEAHGRRGDVLLGLSTSGNSENVIRALEKAGEIGMYRVAFTGKNRDCGVSKVADTVLYVESDSTARIQEGHITAGHIICDIVEQAMVRYGKK